MQLLGLNVLCFCGACPASHILIPVAAAAEPETHACCHHAAAASAVDASAPTVAGQSCCGDDHVWRPATALTPDAHAPLLQTASLVWAIQPPIAPHIRTPALPSSRRFLARGPPPVPIYLRHLSLQI